MALGSSSAQTAYSQNPAAAYAGLVADSAYTYSVSCNPGSGVTDPGFGYFVIRGASEGLFALPAASTDITTYLGLGVIAYEPGRTPTNYSVSALQPNTPRRILRRGLIWVVVEEAVTDGAPVYVRYGTGSGGSQKGAFRTSADTSTAALLGGACYRGAAGIGGLVKVELNLP